ncbi:hypothetical protein BH24PSE2_BH24PSE2_12860 [soil metagenome]
MGTDFEPVFFIGFPRSGTTVAFEVFSRHEELGWPTMYSEWFPHKPWVNVLRMALDNRYIRIVGEKKQYGRKVIGNRFLPQPSEAYRFWDAYAGYNFSRSYLHDISPDQETIQRVRAAVAGLLRWQGKPRFSAKLTGPPRMMFLSKVFPTARFVHVVRDGRAAVHSVLNVGFWRDQGGLVEPLWAGGISERDLRVWRTNGGDAGLLAGLQWKRILEVARIESETIGKARYREVRYEDFVQSPHSTLSDIYGFCGLSDSSEGHEYIDRNIRLQNMNDKYREDFTEDYLQRLNDVMEPMLAKLRYSQPSAIAVKESNAPA